MRMTASGEVLLMAINIAGTNAVGGYLSSQLQNTRILFGEDPTTGAPVAASSALTTSSITTTPTTAPTTSPTTSPTTPASAVSSASASNQTSLLPSPAQLQGELASTALANAETLFGNGSGSNASAPTSAPLPTLSTQTPQQIAQVGIQSSLINQEFSNTETLFGSLGLGSNLNVLA